MPSLKQTIRLPEDVDLLERLNNAISNAMTDNDRDVSLLARAVNDAYKRTPVRMGARWVALEGPGWWASGGMCVWGWGLGACCTRLGLQQCSQQC